ncbi:DUF262 domain-containing protein [Zobellia roscoffensis]|uniref:GmrSD restriction endonuclease domain-containing protein n=1 Tax=Zobellia roscoffensis TaxID=2779508 RepID=UPI00188D0696|nr:DUF262 domain-containing protein [Zobellia roscoffensis]
MPNVEQQEQLIQELNTEKIGIKTDSYSMSIGEIINLYKDEELELNPAYQRLFRWKKSQKSKFIESILLGIPIPPIFVAQKEDGTWSIVDGVQRISTILQLTNDLRNNDLGPLVLENTKKLPSLEGFTWETLPSDLKRTFRRSKFGVNIILTQNSIQSQYELFQRLNTGGLTLQFQEIRNCLIIMLDSDYYEKINQLKSHPSFLNVISVNENKLKEEYHMELILRYFIGKFNNVNYQNYRMSSTHLSEFIDSETTNLIDNQDFNLDEEIILFKRVMDLLHDRLGTSAFKKYYAEKKVFEGQFSNSSFEAITSGLALNIALQEGKTEEQFLDKIRNMYAEEGFLEFSARGVKAIQRFKGLNDFSRTYFES